MTKLSRNTIARQRILELIHSHGSAISHALLQEKLEGTCDRVTTYRVLERLVNESLIHRIVNINGVVNYAACKICEHSEKHVHQHIHFSCVSCGKVQCITENPITIQLPKNFKATEYQLTIAGNCPECI
jgi:Fur family ferric uptake transcriptional regulator